MTTVAKSQVKIAIAHAEQFASVLQPAVRRDIALGRVAMWARLQDAGATERLAQNVIEMSDAIVAHYSSLDS